MKIPVSILFSGEDEAVSRLRGSFLASTTVSGVSDATRWKNMSLAEKEALVEAYYGKKKAIPVADLDVIAVEEPTKAVEEEP